MATLATTQVNPSHYDGIDRVRLVLVHATFQVWVVRPNVRTAIPKWDPFNSK